MADSPDDRLADRPGRAAGPTRPPPEPDEDAPPAPPPPADLQLPLAIVRPGHVRCPYCLQLAEQYVVGLSSGLGPPLMQCRKCGGLFLSLRREWIDMPPWRKAWFVAASVLYAEALAVGVAAATAFALFVVRASLPVWAVVLHAAGWAAAVPVVQGWRIARSLRRTRSPERTPYRPSRWSLDHGWALRFMAGAVLTTVALAWLAYLLRSR